MRWTVRPPTLESGVTNDPLHTDWERAKQILSERLSALDEVNQPPKLLYLVAKSNHCRPN